MNRSGAAIAPLRTLPDFDPSRDLLVVVDDVALPVGRFRMRGAGSSGGHNGLKSIEGTLQRQDYPRLRIGVGPAPAGLEDLADFVLDGFTQEEDNLIDQLLDPMSEAVETWLEHGIEQAMNQFNR
jgi:PTH1 family peptidyl-tRNA hydrolase